ncbi:MAG TPA: c-type cytochrome domain-containing protein [Chitinophagaceae bacterium]|nr:c-type cytochrome domain-containing protein [Chitinophagaceae bacterium]
MKKILFISIVFALAVFACKHEPLLPIGPKDPIPRDTLPNGSSNVCFTRDVLPIFVSYCARQGCHDNITHEGDFILDSYDNIIRKDFKQGNANETKIYKVLIATNPEDIMPPPGNLQLTQSQKDLIKQWINEGGRNTTCTTTCDSSLFTYSGFVQPLLQKNCNGCHNTTNPAGGIDLTAFAVVKSYALNGKLYGSISHSPGYIAMPPTLTSKLSDCEITQVKKWIDAGAPQN